MDRSEIRALVDEVVALRDGPHNLALEERRRVATCQGTRPRRPGGRSDGRLCRRATSLDTRGEAGLWSDQLTSLGIRSPAGRFYGEAGMASSGAPYTLLRPLMTCSKG